MDQSDLVQEIQTIRTAAGELSAEVQDLSGHVTTNTEDIATLSNAIDDFGQYLVTSNVDTQALTVRDLADVAFTVYKGGPRDYTLQDMFDITWAMIPNTVTEPEQPITDTGTFSHLIVSDPDNLAFTTFQGSNYEPPFSLLELLEHVVSLATDNPEYEHPSNISLETLEVNTITSSDYPELIRSQGSIIPTEDSFYQPGDPEHKWIEGHFTSIYANNLNVTDAGGTSRRVLLEGDTVDASVSWADITGMPNFAQVAFSGSFNDLSDTPTLVLAADLGAYATTSYVDTAVSGLSPPDLGAYATVQYVDDSISGLSPPDLSSYATTQFVTDSISGLSPPSDLSTYATTQYVDDSISGLSPPDLSSYATLAYVDQSLANISTPDLAGYATETWVQQQGYLTTAPTVDVRHTIVGATTRLSYECGRPPGLGEQI